MKILYLSKTTDWCNKAKGYILKHFDEVDVIQGEWSKKFPNEIKNWKGDYIISFLSPWVIPQEILNKSKQKPINFHPGTIKYGGIGCYNFAIYNEEKEYGVLCHEMEKDVDTGKIIKVRMFPISNDESVLSLKEKSMEHLLKLFYEIIKLIKQGETLPLSKEKWQKKPYTRKQLQELCRITKDMSLKEIQKRFRATYYPNARDLPYLEIKGKKISLKEMPKNGLEDTSF